MLILLKKLCFRFKFKATLINTQSILNSKVEINLNEIIALNHIYIKHHLKSI